MFSEHATLVLSLPPLPYITDTHVRDREYLILPTPTLGTESAHSSYLGYSHVLPLFYLILPTPTLGSESTHSIYLG